MHSALRGALWLNSRTDVGASQMIIDGKIKVKSSGPIKRFTKTGMVFEDGSELQADVVIFASGFGDSRVPMREVVDEDVGKRIPPIWNLDYEGETRGAWKELGTENLWCMMGTWILLDTRKRRLRRLTVLPRRQLRLVPLLLKASCTP